ncbi:hypothetical protein [Photobacterium kishitanii]|uniref:hypothetical protein n=1 Tax=Photobacterium kishitanii TaxID=318456 RepID=UPI00273A581A|nr:hypothetical protein [Photobacterium kishitanii]
MLDINQGTVDNLVNECWKVVQDKIESGNPLSSEKTLCFLFTMEVASRVGKSLVIDFENQCYGNLDGKSKYLDLLFYTDESYKIAIEFKLPTKSKKGNSNQTQTRENVYRDLARLKFLKTSNLSPKACYFLMAVNEDSYLNNGCYRKGLDFITADGHTIKSDNNIIAEGISLSGVECSFIWHNTLSTEKN